MKWCICVAVLSGVVLASCAQPARPPHDTGKPLRTGTGNAQLEGASADEVIWQSTRQWHADRWHDKHRRNW